MIGNDGELLTELARLATAMPSLAMSIMDGTASAAQQHKYAQRLIAAGQQLKQRAVAMRGAIVEGEVVVDGSLTLPAHTVEPLWIREQRS